MKSFKNIAVTITLASVLAACAQITLVKPGTTTIGDTLSVETQIPWNKLPPNNGMETWTLDGTGLQALTFNTKIGAGENIARQSGADSGPAAKYKNMPVFRKGMNALEISELFVASYQQLGLAGVQVSGLRSEAFAGRNGFYFELDFTDKEGLERRSVVRGTVQGDVMHVITFSAPKLHYFDRDRQRVERIIESARFLSAAGA
tara:strand:+ start:3076 stop:3684 length:609 start_codon:yes stop_codon:yes gene_type:complete